ncbi:hypothetical protein [Kibdelosporangium philippinense]
MTKWDKPEGPSSLTITLQPHEADFHAPANRAIATTPEPYQFRRSEQ